MAISAPSLLTTGVNTYPSSTATTASVTPSSNKLILLWIQSFGSANTPTAVSGNGITYTHVLSTNDYNGGFGASALHLFRGLAASPSSGTISITGASGTQELTWTIEEIGSVDTGGTNGSAAVVQSAEQETGVDSTSLSVTLAAFADAGNGTVCGVHTYDSGNTRTQGSGFTLSHNGDSTNHPSTEYRTDNDTTADWTFGSATMAGAIAVEVKPSAGGGGSTELPPLTMPPMVSAGWRR